MIVDVTHLSIIHIYIYIRYVTQNEEIASNKKNKNNNNKMSSDMRSVPDPKITLQSIRAGESTITFVARPDSLPSHVTAASSLSIFYAVVLKSYLFSLSYPAF